MIIGYILNYPKVTFGYKKLLLRLLPKLISYLQKAHHLLDSWHVHIYAPEQMIINALHC